MRYYSDITKKLYEDENELKKAELDYRKAEHKKAEKARKKSEERAARAKEVELALQELTDAKKKYNELLKAFCKDYGSFHYSFSDASPDLFLSDLLSWF